MKKITRLHPVKHAGIIAKMRELWENRASRPITLDQIGRRFGVSAESAGDVVNYRQCVGVPQLRGNYRDTLVLDPKTPAYPSDADEERADRLATYEEADADWALLLGGRVFIDHERAPA